MTRDEALHLACRVRDALPWSTRQRLKAIDVIPRLHDGMLTIRVYAKNEAAAEPETYVFRIEEL